MYRSCIFCSAVLGSNESIERFPVGRSLAFDGEKGRLWAVCPKCARWNLAPIEERWDAIEDAERLFRDTRLRVQSENVGLAKLRDGTRLIRIGEALPGELAAWRYGREMQRRRLRQQAAFWLGVGAPLTVYGAMFLSPLAPLALLLSYPLIHVCHYYSNVEPSRRADRVAYRIAAAESPTRLPLTLRWRDLALVSTAWDDERGLALRVRQTREFWGGSSPLVISGPTASAILGMAMVHINSFGATTDALEGALDRMASAGGAEPFLRSALAPGHSLAVPGLKYDGEFTRSGRQFLARAREAAAPIPSWLGDDGIGALAAEMALHEETERRALEGELAALEAMWRQAEEIAAIADRLPDLPPPEPPRLSEG